MPASWHLHLPRVLWNQAARIETGIVRRTIVMSKRKLWTASAAVLLVAAIAGGTGAVVATGGDDDEAPITGTALEQASKAALAHTGGGRVSETEMGDEESYYEVEVTLDDGSQVDVQLDESFNVVGDEADDESEDEAASD
jgi:hypothetical protein